MHHIILTLIFCLYILIGMNIFFLLAHLHLFEIDEDDDHFWLKILSFWIIPVFLWPLGMLLGLWWFIFVAYKEKST